MRKHFEGVHGGNHSNALWSLLRSALKSIEMCAGDGTESVSGDYVTECRLSKMQRSYEYKIIVKMEEEESPMEDRLNTSSENGVAVCESKSRQKYFGDFDAEEHNDNTPVEGKYSDAGRYSDAYFKPAYKLGLQLSTKSLEGPQSQAESIQKSSSSNVPKLDKFEQCVTKLNKMPVSCGSQEGERLIDSNREIMNRDETALQIMCAEGGHKQRALVHNLESVSSSFCCSVCGNSFDNQKLFADHRCKQTEVDYEGSFGDVCKRAASRTNHSSGISTSHPKCHMTSKRNASILIQNYDKFMASPNEKDSEFYNDIVYANNSVNGRTLVKPAALTPLVNEEKREDSPNGGGSKFLADFQSTSSNQASSNVVPASKKNYYRALLKSIGFECVMQYNESVKRLVRRKHRKRHDENGPAEVQNIKTATSHSAILAEHHHLPDDLPELSRSACENCDMEFSSVWVLKAHCEEVHDDHVPMASIEEFGAEFKQRYDKKLQNTLQNSQQQGMHHSQSQTQKQQQHTFGGNLKTSSISGENDCYNIPSSGADNDAANSTANEFSKNLSAQVMQHLSMLMPMEMAGLGLPPGMIPPHLSSSIMSMMMPALSNMDLYANMFGMGMFDPVWAIGAAAAQQSKQKQQLNVAASQQRHQQMWNDQQQFLLQEEQMGRQLEMFYRQQQQALPISSSSSTSFASHHHQPDQQDSHKPLSKHQRQTSGQDVSQPFWSTQQQTQLKTEPNTQPACSEDGAASATHQKRGRTRINDDQLTVLRAHFDISNSPSDDQVAAMVGRTSLPAKVIKHWFRNTLFKERQRSKDSPYNFSIPPSALTLDQHPFSGSETTTVREVKNTGLLFMDRAEGESVTSASGGERSVIVENRVDVNAMITHMKEEMQTQNADESSPMSGDDEEEVQSPCPSNPTSSASSAAGFASSSLKSLDNFNGTLGAMASGCNGLLEKLPTFSDATSPSSHHSRRANRTHFSDGQVRVLQEHFETNPYPKDEELESLSKILELSPRVIIVWFQNARQKARKLYENQVLGGSVNPNSAATTHDMEQPLNLPPLIPLSLLHEPMEINNESNYSATTSAMKYECSTCRATFERYYELIKHQRMHSCNEKEKRMEAAAYSSDSRPQISPPPLAYASDYSSSDDEGAPKREIYSSSAATNKSISFGDVCSVGRSEMSDFKYSSFPTTDADARVNLPLAAGSGGGAFDFLQSAAQLHAMKSLADGDQSWLLQPDGEVCSDADQQRSQDRRMRTTILPSQLDYLNAMYRSDCNPSRKQLNAIAAGVGLKKRVVQVWFQNTRARERKIQPGLPGSPSQYKNCSFCPATFNSAAALEAHVGTKHFNEIVRSPGNPFDSKEATRRPLSSSGGVCKVSPASSCGVDIAQLMNNPYSMPMPFLPLVSPMGLMYPLGRVATDNREKPTQATTLQENGGNSSLRQYRDSLAAVQAMGKGIGGELFNVGRHAELPPSFLGRRVQELPDSPLDLSTPVRTSFPTIRHASSPRPNVPSHQNTEILKSIEKGEASLSTGSRSQILDSIGQVEQSTFKTAMLTVEQFDPGTFKSVLLHPDEPDMSGGGDRRHEEEGEEDESKYDPLLQSGVPTKRHRTHMSSVQIRAMKAIYTDYKTPTIAECDSLGREIGLRKRVVQVSETRILKIYVWITDVCVIYSHNNNNNNIFAYSARTIAQHIKCAD